MTSPSSPFLAPPLSVWWATHRQISAGQALPFILEKASAGFENPALDFAVKTLDLNDLLLLNPRSTFYSLVSGNCMAASGILDGDVAVIDSALPFRQGDVVLADFDGAFTIKHYYRSGSVIRLVPADDNYPTLEPKDGQQVRVLGKVTASITLFAPLARKLQRARDV